ncbi:MAG: NADH-quinone oxidoreductase subunit A [Candidatus Riflebacteria bacterium]|nr:NADH-quinone oxidoreductase subunit A [Candidatus Riflebacteria bacterium]
MLFDYSGVLILFVLGAANLAFMIVLPKLLRPYNPTEQKMLAYECGESPVGTGWMQYNLRFFTVALVFIVFDVEIVFMFPWAVVFRQLSMTQGALPFWEMAVFIAILPVALAYLWKQGLLDWVRSVRRA